MLLKKKKLKEYSGNYLKVFIVNSDFIKKQHSLDFMFGHSLSSEFIPDGEIWIIDKVAVDKLKYIVYRMLYEYRLMANGLTFDDARNLASQSEDKALRKGNVDELIKSELSKVGDLIIESSHYNGQIHNGIHDKNNVHHAHKSKVRELNRYESSESGISMTR